MKESWESSDNEAEERGDEIRMRKYEVRRDFFEWLEWKEGDQEREGDIAWKRKRGGEKETKMEKRKCR